MVHVVEGHTWPHQGPTLETIFEPPLVRPMPRNNVGSGGPIPLTLLLPCGAKGMHGELGFGVVSADPAGVVAEGLGEPTIRLPLPLTRSVAPPYRAIRGAINYLDTALVAPPPPLVLVPQYSQHERDCIKCHLVVLLKPGRPSDEAPDEAPQTSQPETEPDAFENG